MGRELRGVGWGGEERGVAEVIATAQVIVTAEDHVAATCLTLRSLEGLHTNTAVVSNQVNTGSSIQAWVRAAFIHIWGP